MNEFEKRMIIFESFLDEAQSTKHKVLNVLGLLFFFPLSWIMWRVIRSQTNKCHSKCGMFGFQTARRQLCIAKCNMIQLNEIGKMIEKSKSDPNFDKDNYDLNISKLKSKKIKLQRKIDNLTKEVMNI